MRKHEKSWGLYKADYPVCMCEGKGGMFFNLLEEAAHLSELGCLFLISVPLRLANVTKNCGASQSLQHFLLRPKIQTFSFSPENYVIIN